MAFYKNKRETQQLGNKIIFKNITHDSPFQPFKKYYGIIEHEGSEKVFDYVAKFRCEAEAYFDELARLLSGKLKLISFYKN